MPSNDYAAFTALMRENRFREAAALAEARALDTATSPEFWLTHQSRALMRAGNFSAALDSAEHALRAAPSNGWAQLAHADALLRNGRTAEALAEYQAVSTNPQVGGRGFDGLMQALEKMGRWDELLTRCNQGDLEPLRRERYRARALAGLDRTDEAIAACRACLDHSPDDPQILWTLTDQQVRTEGLETVLTQLSRIVRIPGKPSIYREIYASLCRKAGRHDTASEQYGSMAGKGDMRISGKQAFALAKAGREVEAIPLLEELLRSSPDDFYVNSSYIGACKRTGALVRADAFYQELLGRFPESTGIFGRIRKVRAEMARLTSINDSDDQPRPAAAPATRRKALPPHKGTGQSSAPAMEQTESVVGLAAPKARKKTAGKRAAP